MVRFDRRPPTSRHLESDPFESEDDLHPRLTVARPRRRSTLTVGSDLDGTTAFNGRPASHSDPNKPGIDPDLVTACWPDSDV